MQTGWRILCLGNDLLGDDAMGYVVARRLKKSGSDVIFTSDSGLNLLDHMVGVRALVVVDTLLTGAAAPGSVFLLGEKDIPALRVPSPHYLGLAEALLLGRQLGLPVPERVVFIGVEAADCSSIGGNMHTAVRAAIPVVVNYCLQLG